MLYYLLLACKPDSGLTKYNALPEAQITSPTDGSAVLEGTTLTLRGQASDPNHAASELLARWFVNGSEACASVAPAMDGSTACEVVVPEADALAVRLEVLDTEGAGGVAEATYAVTRNEAPVAAIASPVEDGVYYSDQLVVLRATVDDAEDAPEDLTVRWESNRDGQLDAPVPNSEGLVESFVALSEGAHALQLFVTDTAGNEGRATVLVDVGPPNSAPECAITAPASGNSVEQGSRVELLGLATDVDVPSSRLTVAWESDKDGALGTSVPDSDGSVGYTASALSADTHRITMRVTDEVGAECTTSVVLTVGTPPTLEVLSPTDGDVVNEGEDLAFLATVSDAEDVASALTVTWESDLDGTLSSGSPDSTGEAGFLASDLAWGDHALTVTATDSSGLFAVERLAFTVNGLPSAPGVSITPTAPYGDDDLVVAIDVASVDPEGDRLTYSYAWYQNGVLSGASSSATLPGSATSRGDRWTVEVWASDGLGESPVGSASVTIGDTLPTIASVSLSPSPATTNDTLACVASGASDADGESVTLAYAWTVNGTTLSETGSTLAGSWFEKGDVVMCSVTPRAGSGTGSGASSAPLTIENSIPSLAIASIAPAAPRAGDTLTCSTTGWSDADGDPDGTSYAWTVNGRAAGTGSTFTGTYVGGDVVTCTATPFDGEDNGSPVSVSVSVSNTSPVLADVSLTPASAREGDTLTCTPGSTTDADGTTAFTYTYAWRVNGVAVSASTATLTSASFDAGDTVACVVTPNDGTSSGSAVTSNAVTIANTAPVLASVSVTPSAPTETDTLTCVTGSATDADGDAVSFTYAWSVDGVPVAGATTATLTGTAFDREEEVTCTATPFDGAAYGASLTSSGVTVENTAPSIDAVTLSPAAPTATSTITCTYTGYDDPDADPEGVRYAWTVNGARVASTAATLSGGFVGGDVVSCTVTPDDATDTGTPRSANVTVANTVPVLASVSLTPTAAREGDTLTCAPGSTTDADGTTAFTYAYAWRVNGVAASATTSTLTSASFNRDDTVACVVTPNDGTGAGSAVTSNTVTVSNTAPTLASVSITPAAPTRSSTLTCTPAGASDADGDSVSYSYAWTLDGVAAGSASTLAGPFTSGSVAVCTVTPTDGTTAGSAVTASATITNTAPVVSSVTLTPSTVYTNDTLTASAVSSDADGDTVSLEYAWFVNGVLVAETGASLSGAAYFDRDDVVSVQVTPSDADGAGAAVTSSSVTVSNTAPSAPTVAITPSAPVSGDSLTCSVTGASTDADGDSLSYTFAWDVDGVAYTGASGTATTSTVAGSVVDGSESWTCEVEVSDATFAAFASFSTYVERRFVAFTYTGSVQTWHVPLGVTSVEVDVRGAQGGGAYWSYTVIGVMDGGLGARVNSSLSVSPGETLYIYVGGVGSTASAASCSGYDSLRGAGWNGGGNGNRCGGGGGGASDIRRGGTSLSNRIVVAGGGGGSAGGSCSVPGYAGTPGGAGGGLVGQIGQDGRCGSSGDAYPGGGGTQVAGGAGGYGCGASGTSGHLGQGGDGYGGYSTGGGGGYFGGGGSGSGCYGRTAGGGGGSSLVPSGGIPTDAFQAGNGEVFIYW